MTIDETVAVSRRREKRGEQRYVSDFWKFSGMISLIAQERLLGAALGSVLMGGMIFQQRRGIYRSISELECNPSHKSQFLHKETVSGLISRANLAHMWNKTVDDTLGSAIKYLSSRGW